MINLSDYLTSLIRTGVPIGVGIVAAWMATKLGFVVDEESQANLVATFTGAAIGAYYAAVRWIETKVPWVGWFLGYAKKPKY